MTPFSNNAKSSLITALFFINFLALLVLPGLNNVHYDPLPQFFAESTTAWAIISMFILSCICFQRIAVPLIILPLLALTIYFAIQPFFTPIAFPGLSYTASIEFAILALLSISIATLGREFGYTKLLLLVTTAIVIGTFLQSIIGLLQYTGWYKEFLAYIFYDSVHPRSDIFGHFGQRNHYCDYLTWGVFSLIYILVKRKIHPAFFWALILWFAFSLTIASSRSVLIYLILAVLISAICYSKNRRSKPHSRLFFTILFVTIIITMFGYIYPSIHKHLAPQSQISSGVERITQSYQSGNMIGRRSVEWSKAWITFKKQPILGVGFNQYAAQSVWLQPLFPHAPENDGLFTNCHNLILQLLAETGLIGTIIVILGIAESFYFAAKKLQAETIIIWCILVTIIAHSMLEYPLWYLYFLAPFILFLTYNQPVKIISVNYIIGLVIAPLSYLVYLLVSQSLIFNTIVSYNDPPNDFSTYKEQALALYQITKDNTLLDYAALYSLDNYINVDNYFTNQTFSIRQQLTLENKFTNFHPYPDNLIKQAKLNWIIGNKAQAITLTNLALIAYPVYKDDFISQLQQKHHQYQELLDIAKNYNY